MTKQSHLMQIDGSSPLGNMLGLAKSLIFRSQPVVLPKKITPTMPKRKGSAIAAVLAKLLSGEELNCIDQADDLGSSRLKDHISNLRKRHGWEAIESMPVAIATADGRVQWVMEYGMPLSFIKLHNTEETRIWINEVQSMRRSKRAEYKTAELRALLATSEKLLQLLDATNANSVSERGGA